MATTTVLVLHYRPLPYVLQKDAQVAMNSAGSNILSFLKSIFKTPPHFKKLLFAAVLLLLFYTYSGNHVTNNQFDYLLFSQRWLPTACIEYMEHHSRPVHHCILPKNFQSWTIHGLWPTQKNHMGPFFCNKSLPFDLNKLMPIESELEKSWPNIEEGKGVASLWQHEWEKHGTCAAQLNLLNSEIKYFSTTLKLFKAIDVQSALSKYGILPNLNKGINVTDLFHTLKNAFGKLPQIHCIQEVKTKRPFLSEIRFCYNKNLELIDCGDIINSKLNAGLDGKNSLTNCPLNSKLIYPQTVISEADKVYLKKSLERSYYDSLVHTLTLVKFLQWALI